jgi:hypothetical protein
MTKNWEKFTAGQKKIGGLKTTIFLSLGLVTEVKATKKPSAHKRDIQHLKT